MSRTLLTVTDLRFTYPDGTEALRGIDLRIEVGERVAVLGPNGAGKTTLALHLIGILRTTTGSVVVDGLALNDDNVREIRRRVGFVFQESDDQLFMPTVRQDVAFGPANFGLAGAGLTARVESSLAAVGAADLVDRAPHHLSGGERRRVALATVLATDPELLVLDEPTSDLDPAGRRQLVDLLAGLERTLLVVTHDLSFALELCPRSIVMNNGRVVAGGATDDLLADAALLAANRLELPYGFHPANVRR
jgi:cobalt transport protein ATP-binding subunit